MIYTNEIKNITEATHIMMPYGVAVLELLEDINYPITIGELFNTIKNKSHQNNQLREYTENIITEVAKRAELYNNKLDINNQKQWVDGIIKRIEDEFFLQPIEPFLNQDTKIISMGSCFAVEIAR